MLYSALSFSFNTGASAQLRKPTGQTNQTRQFLTLRLPSKWEIASMYELISLLAFLSYPSYLWARPRFSLTSLSPPHLWVLELLEATHMLGSRAHKSAADGVLSLRPDVLCWLTVLAHAL